MDIDGFMENYKRAWETSDENLLASLFATDGSYRNTPFATQRGHEAIKQYWQRTKLQTDIKLAYEVLQRHASGGIAHWHTTYQVTSEDMFKMWAASTGTNNNDCTRHPPGSTATARRPAVQRGLQPASGADSHDIQHFCRRRNQCPECGGTLPPPRPARGGAGGVGWSARTCPACV